MTSILPGLGLRSLSTREFRGFELTSTVEGPEALFLDTIQHFMLYEIRMGKLDDLKSLKKSAFVMIAWDSPVKVKLHY